MVCFLCFLFLPQKIFFFRFQQFQFSLCSDGVDWFNARGQFQDASYVPATGDIIFFDWGNDGSINHVGIVESVTNGVVNTIEGNSGDKVARRSYNMGSDSIYGYGVVAY